MGKLIDEYLEIVLNDHQFLRFLKEMKCYNKFFKALMHHPILTEDDIKRMDRGCHIASAFSWMDSDEGFTYWSVKSRDWKRYVNEQET